MQISRKVLVACAAACATTLAARATDTPAQIKAREAMLQKLQQAEGQQTSSAPAVITRSDSDAIAKAREALHQQLQQNTAAPATTSTPAPAPAPIPQAPTPAPAPALAPAPAAPAAVATDAPVPPPATPIQRADPDAIAKAREAVRQRIEESPATPPPVTTPAPVAAPAAVATPAPVATPAAPVTTPAPVAATPEPPAAQAAPPPPPEPAPAPAPVPAPEPTPAPAPAAPAATFSSAPAASASAPQPVDSETIAKARNAVRQQINENNEPGPKADGEGIAKAREAVRQRMQSITYAEPTSRAGNGPGMNFQPLEGPPLPISSEKQQRLYELLQRYKADQVTPEQYQEERAKILAGK